MGNEQIKPDHGGERQQQLARWTARIFMALGLASLMLSFYVVLVIHKGRFDLSDIILMPMAALLAGVNLMSLRLMRRGRLALVAWLLFASGALLPPVAAVLVFRGLGLASVTYVVLVASILIEFMLPKSSRRAAIAAALAAVLLSMGIEWLDPDFRVAADLQGTTNVFSALAGLGMLALFARGFRDFSLRVKLLLSIMLVSLVSVAIIGYFAYSRFQQSQLFLSGELQTAVQQQARQQLNDTAQTEADKANHSLLEVSSNVETLATYRAALYSKSSILQADSYWDGHAQLKQLAGGQYGNSPADVASVFIPSTIPPDDPMIVELNTSAYLDFVVPAVMKSNPTIIAMYYMSNAGPTTYYPNIDLAENVPPDFDARTQPFYAIVTPENDPERRVVWSEPYQDPAGTGLIVTSAAPVYDQEGQFRGVLAADVQLVKIADQIGSIHVGKSGFAFLIDPAGHLIAMREASTNAFIIFGLNYEPVPVNETPKQTVLNRGPADLQEITRHMVAGEHGLAKTTIAKIEYYVVYAPLAPIGYSLALIVPVSELDAPYLNAQSQIENTTQTTLNLSLVILALVLLVGTGVSMFLSRSISKPLVDLTEVVRRVALGNLGMRAQADTQDETGKLSRAFNAMTTQLRDLIGTLEQRVADRTKALATSAEISRQLSTILNRKELVTEVVNQVRNAFNYYHAHIYFFDEAQQELVMAGGTGEAGQTMLAQGHKIPKGRGLVGRAAETNHAVLVSDTSKNRDWLPNPLLPDTKSEVAIPISAGDEVLGVLDVQQNITDGLQQADVDSLQSIANQVAVAIQNIQAEEIVAKRATELQTVATISTAAATISDIDKMLHTVVHLTQRQFGLYHCHIFIYNETTAEVRIAACGWKEGDPHEGTDGAAVISIAQEQSLVARAFRTRQAVIVNDVHVEPGWLPNPLLPETQSEMAVPLIVGDQVLGVLDVQSERLKAFTQEDANIQTTLASQVATALQNARTFSQTQRQAERETMLNVINQKIQSATSVEAVLQIAARELGRALNAPLTIAQLGLQRGNGNRDGK